MDEGSSFYHSKPVLYGTTPYKIGDETISVIYVYDAEKSLYRKINRTLRGINEQSSSTKA